MSNYEQTVYVDADACPVKDEIEELCRKYKKKVVFVASYAHSLQRQEDSIIVMVDSRMEEVDLYIVNHCKRGDIVVTQDHGLASLLLPKGIIVISPRGKQFLNETIEELLLARYLGKMQRKAGLKTKGPNKFTNEDIIKFIKQFENILSNKEGF
ncbi:MAG: YaiI/YqxD family protein [Anaerobacillus sp.]|uniref:YaiI/YqxD family protein n=1 Tax=Anaerobacillus sp. TaxID=1872506 RepID=UPI00391A9E28